MSKVPLLLFSGGLDSTFMLQTALMEGDVETLYVSGAQCPNKVKKELAARKRIIDKLERICKHRVRRDHVIQMENLLDGSTPDHKFVQPMAWIYGALKVSDGGDRHSELRIGYVNGDSIMVNLQNVLAVWDQAQHFTKWHPLPLVFPLMYMHKDDILHRLNPHVWEDVWVCEMPKRKGAGHTACGSCRPCLTQAAVLHLYAGKYGETYAARNERLLKEFKLPRRPRAPRLLALESSAPLEIQLPAPPKRKKHGHS